MYNKFLALSREVEYAVNHIDHKNVTPTFSKEMSNDRDNITKLEQTADNITISVANLERTCLLYTSRCV